MLVFDINVKIKDDKNSNIQMYIPVALESGLKLKSHIPFLKPEQKDILSSLLPSLNEKAEGILIEVDNKDCYIKVEVIKDEITNSL